MKIGVISADSTTESRVALTPDAVKKLRKLGFEVVVQSGAGLAAYYTDDSYQTAGADIASSSAEVVEQSQIITTISDLPAELTETLKPKQIVVGMLDPYRNTQLETYATKGATVFAMELLPRTLSRAQNMDVLSSQANLAGYKAVLLAANEYSRPFPMFMTSAGTVKPAKVVILGVGVAGLQAIATASRLGAKVEAFDVRPVAREQVESLGAKFLYMDLDDSAETDSGYAVEMNEEFIRKEMELLHDAAKRVDAIITTALIFGRPAPILIKDYMVNDMQPGSCIIDMAAENGGNCELTKPGEIIHHNGVTIDGTLNLPAQVPYHASQMLSKNISKLLTEVIEDGKIKFDLENDIIKGCLVTHEKNIIHEMTKNIIEGNT